MDRKLRNFKNAWLAYKHAKSAPCSSFNELCYHSNNLNILAHTSVNSIKNKQHLDLKELVNVLETCSKLLEHLEARIFIKKTFPKISASKVIYDLSGCNLKKLKKLSFSESSLISTFKCFFLISLPITLIWIRNFSIQKNLSISA